MKQLTELSVKGRVKVKTSAELKESLWITRRRATAEVLRPSSIGLLRPFGCDEFIRDFLMGLGPNGSL